MKKWEHMQRFLESGGDMYETLHLFGEQGWEMCGVVEHFGGSLTIWFKRAKSDDNP